MQIGLLGALEVIDDDGREVVVRGAKLRALLAVLSLPVGRVVSTEQLAEALWGEDPPVAVRNGLQGLVSKLRRALGAGEVVAMRGGGYALDLAAEAVDVYRYERLVAAARAAASTGDLGDAVELLAEADSLWRGDPLAEFAYEDFAAVHIARLAELRLDVTEEQLDLELRLGRHQRVVGRLEELVSGNPLREGLRGLLMLSLYRSGRQADALRVFQEARRLLGEELGLEPGPDLRRLEAAILAHDPSLDAPVEAASGQVGQPVVRWSIPESVDPLIGRDTELKDLAGLLADHRFVTLVGPGGVGKTRLALEAARAVSAGLRFGACVVELARVGDPADVPAAIATALGLPDPAGLAEVIGERELLLVLDNCEHVISAAADAAEGLLSLCPALRVLATSREGLRVGGEIVWAVPPLAVADAVGLFVARAEAAGALLDRPGGEVSSITDICTRLDGLPLAIELAAARTRVFPVEMIASRLDDRFRLLTGGSRTALPRQQTLRAVVDWSYELLFEDEQRIFERLAVFPGGCDLLTAESVCADETLSAADVDDLVAALVDKSLVVATRIGDSVRFTQLQILAQYAREKLADRGDADAIRGAMATHFATLCAESAAAYIGDRQRAWLETIDREQDNLRAALAWAVATDDAETALTIAGGASWTHWLAGTLMEGRRWLDDAFACGGEVSASTRALGLIGRGLLEFMTGAPERADADLTEAITVFGALGDDASKALALSFHTEIAAARGDVEEARRRRLEILEFYATWSDSPFVVAARAFSHGKLAVIDGDLVEAERHYRAAAQGFASIDRPVMLSMSLGMVADFDERAGNHAAAVEVLEEALSTNDQLGLRGFTGSLLVRLGWGLLHIGDVARAQAIYERALEEARRLQYAPRSSVRWQATTSFLALTGIAVVYRSRGRNDEAAAASTEALELHLAGGPTRFRNRIDPRADILVAAATCCSLLAALDADAGEGDRAARLLGHAERLRAEADATVPPFLHDDVDAARATATALLGDERFAAAVESGRREPADRILAVTSMEAQLEL